MGAERLHPAQGAGAAQRDGQAGELPCSAADIQTLQGVQVELPDVQRRGQPGVPAARRSSGTAPACCVQPQDHPNLWADLSTGNFSLTRAERVNEYREAVCCTQSVIYGDWKSKQVFWEASCLAQRAGLGNQQAREHGWEPSLLLWVVPSPLSGSCYLRINNNKERFDLRAWSSSYF